MSTDRRRPLPFKPPRPVGSRLGGELAARDESAGSKRKRDDETVGRPSKNATKSRTAAVLISSDEDESGVSGTDITGDESSEDSDASRTQRAARTVKDKRMTAAADASRPQIPEKLLARLLYESFSDKNTKIGKDALAVFGKYVEIFVREALARAAFEREEADGVLGSIADGFLQVEDLEKLAPQLLLDF